MIDGFATEEMMLLMNLLNGFIFLLLLGTNAAREALCWICTEGDCKKNVELIMQVNLLQELSQGITRYPTPALSQVWRCKGFHRVLDVLFSDQNCPSRIRPHVLTMEVDKISH